MARGQSPAQVGNSWNVPIWTDASSYSLKKLTTPSVSGRYMLETGKLDKEDLQRFMWRWQFLRRDAAYRADWSQPNNRTDESFQDKWGFRGPLPDPRENQPRDLFFAEMVGAVSDRAPIFRIPFDLRLSIEPQLGRARQMLLEAQDYCGLTPNRTHVHKKQWAKQLRALDAREQHASFTEIGELLQTNKASGWREGKRLYKAAIRTQGQLTRVPTFDLSRLKPRASSPRP